MGGPTESERRKYLHKEYSELFDRLSQLLFLADPIGISFDTNNDEYDPEVGTILPRLQYAQSESDVQQKNHEEFCTWFDVDNAGSIEAYEEIAVQFWNEWQRYRESPYYQALR